MEENQETDLAETILDGRKCQNTRNSYQRKYEHFRMWMKEKYPLCFRESGSTLDLGTIEKSHLLEFFGHICKKKSNSGTYLHPIQYQSFQHVSGYKSAIKDHFANLNHNLKDDIEKFLKNFFGGYMRKIASLKQDGEMSIIEGKMPLSFRGYKYLAEKATMSREGNDNVTSCRDEKLFIFAHFFLLLCWNLIARCVSVGSLMFNHVSWENDSLVIVFPSHKGDKDGKKALPKHVYANTMEPAICPILSFAIYLFTKGYDREGSKTTIFAGDAESRFSKWLRKVCDVNSETLMNQGVDISMIGTHSFRKGIATFLSGTPGGPTAIAIYLRAGWSLGPVQSRYILEGEGGDQVCGRAATGLPLTDVSFANLPAHFLTLESGLSSAEWDDILPGYTTYYTLNFREVVPYLLASLVYHRSYLVELQAQHPQHPLFLQRVWTSGILDRLRDKVGAGCSRNAISRMSATGVPPHLVLANRIVDMQKGMDLIREEVITKLDGLPEALKQSMLQNFNINGTVPITHLQVVEMMEKLQSSIETTIQSALLQNQTSNSAAAVPTNTSRTGLETETPSSYSTFTWNSRIHPVPENFRFPK
jgi:hypothetical protein